MIQTGLLWQLLNRWYAIFRKKKRRGHHTTLDPCLVQARVRGGLPVHEQVKAASIPMSTVWGFGSVSNLGPTANERCGFILCSCTFHYSVFLCAQNKNEAHYTVLIFSLIKGNMLEYK